MDKSLMRTRQLPEELLAAAKCVYLACGEEPAEHLSQLLTRARARIHELEQGNRSLHRALLEKRRHPDTT